MFLAPNHPQNLANYVKLFFYAALNTLSSSLFPECHVSSMLMIISTIVAGVVLLNDLPVASELLRSDFPSDAIDHSRPVLLAQSLMKRRKGNRRFSIFYCSAHRIHLNSASQSSQVGSDHLFNLSPQIF